MGCLYCGGAIPPHTGRGAKKKFCCPAHQNRYGFLRWKRKQQGQTIEHCRNCGRALRYNQKDYCSEFCRKRGQKTELSIEGINALRMAAIKQARIDGALERWMTTEQFYQLFPELTPDQMKKEKRSWIESFIRSSSS